MIKYKLKKNVKIILAIILVLSIELIIVNAYINKVDKINKGEITYQK